MREWPELLQGFNETNEAEFIAYLTRQRWFGGKSRTIAGVDLVDYTVLRREPMVVLAIVEVRYGAGAFDIYQLTVGVDENESNAADGETITAIGTTRFFDAGADPTLAALIAHAPQDGVVMSGAGGEVAFRSIVDLVGENAETRALGADQSNTSMVVNDKLIIKIYRRIEAGISPELELLLFLTERGFTRIPLLSGWYSYTGADLRATLGMSQEFLPSAIDGWVFGIDEVKRSPLAFLTHLSRLGDVIGEMHAILASDNTDPDFAPEQPTSDMVAILGARIEEQIDHLAGAIPDGRADDLRSVAMSFSGIPPAGSTIRSHGDLHLGQLLWSNDDWYVIDFEGEPARSLVERRQKVSPLRDVAGLLRSIAYLVTALELEHNFIVPPDWEHTAREAFLVAYRDQVTPSGILPNDLEVQDRFIRLFELEKILYELEYEINHRPHWLSVPLTGIDRLLKESSA